MQTLIYSLLLLAGALAFAAESKPDHKNAYTRATIKKIEKSNEAVKDMTGPNPGCSGCVAQSLDENPYALAHQCLVSLCPEGAGDVWYQQGARISAFIASPLSSAAMALPNGAFRSAVEMQKVADEFLLSNLKDKTQITDEKALFMATFLRSSQAASKAVFDSSGKIDVEKSVKNSPADVTPEDLKRVKRYFEVVNGEIPNVLPFLKEDFEALQAKLTPEELKNAAQQAFNERSARRTSAAKFLGIPPELIFQSKASEEALARRIKAREIDAGTHRLLNDSYEVARLVDVLSKDEKFHKLQIKPSAVNDQLPSDIIKILESRIETENAFLEGRIPPDNKFAKTLSDVAQSCQMGFAAGMAMAPEESEAKAFSDIERKMREQFIGAAAKRLSAHSAEALARAANKWKMVPMQSRGEFLKSLKPIFDAETASMASIRTIFEAKDPHVIQVTLALFGSKQMTNDETSEPIKELKATCDKLAPYAGGDHANFKSNTARFTPRTVIFEKGRRSIMFHEYTHLSSNFIATDPSVSEQTLKWYKEKRQCLHDQHVGSKAFDEEDYANVFPGSISNSGENPNVCDSDWGLPELMTLKGENPDGLHSGFLFNALISAMARGNEVPDACKRSLALNGETELPKNCIGRDERAE